MIATSFLARVTAAALPTLLLAVTPAGAADAGRLPRVAASAIHGLIVLPSGAVLTFAHDNKAGQLGQGTIGEGRADDAIAVPGISDAVDAAAGGNSSYVLRADGTVLAWGENHRGQLGLGEPGVLPKSWEVLNPVPTPTPIAGLSGVRQIAAGGKNFAIALLADGTVRAWGSVGKWKLEGIAGSGGEDPFRVPFPAAIEGLSGAKAISAGDGFALALMDDGTVRGWGTNGRAEIGDETIDRSATPIPIAGLVNIVAISAGEDYSLALVRDGTVRVWGAGSNDLSNFGGARGPSIHAGAVPWTAKPLAIPGLRDVTAISAGANAVALLANGTVRTWGYNGYFSMGLGHNTEYPRGMQTPKLSNVAAVATGFNRTYFVTKDGAVLAAGFHRRVRSESFRVPTPILVKR